MNDHLVKASPHAEVEREIKNFPKKEEEISKQQTEKYLLYTLITFLGLLLIILIYMVNEYFVLQSSSSEYLQRHYEFGTDQPFYRESAEAYLNFVLRFIIINGLISFFGLTAIVLRKPWLYLLIIVMAFISIVYFLIL
jgi:hypothetical protein